MIVYKDDRFIDVEVIYKKIKNLYIRVRDNKIIVTSSIFFTEQKIREILLNNFEKYYNLLSKKDDKLSYLGNIYDKEEIESNKNAVVIENNKAFVFYKKDPKKAIDAFYKKECTKILKEWYPLLEAKFSRYNISCKEFKVGCYKSIWGSCNSKTGIVKINAYLMRYDLVYLECILHHEYCHFKYQNHQKEYHKFYDMVYPNNRIYERNLKKLPSY